MGSGSTHGLPDSVLFACTMNAVRSPMAAAILRHLAGPRIHVDSAGIRAGVPDPLLSDVMDEIGIDLWGHRPKTLDDLRGAQFDLIVTLAPEAHHAALEFTRGMAANVEFWPTADATAIAGAGGDEQLKDAYRTVRDQLFLRIKKRFGVEGGPTV